MGSLDGIRKEAHKDKRDRVKYLLTRLDKLMAQCRKLRAKTDYSSSEEYTIEVLQDKMLSILNELRGDTQANENQVPMDKLSAMMLDLIAQSWGKTGKESMKSWGQDELAKVFYKEEPEKDQ